MDYTVYTISIITRITTCTARNHCCVKVYTISIITRITTLVWRLPSLLSVYTISIITRITTSLSTYVVTKQVYTVSIITRAQTNRGNLRKRLPLFVILCCRYYWRAMVTMPLLSDTPLPNAIPRGRKIFASNSAVIATSRLPL